MPPRTLTELRAQEKEARRKLIREAACQLFATTDFKQVTVRQIARQAGLGVGTIYNYYDSLDDLFLDIFLKNAEEITSLLDTAATGGPPPLTELCRLYVNYLNEHLTFYQMMSHFMLTGDLDTRGTERLNRTMRRMLDRIESVVRQTRGDNADTRMLAHALFAALNGIMISYARYPGRSDQEIQTHTRALSEILGAVFAAAAKSAVVQPAERQA